MGSLVTGSKGRRIRMIPLIRAWWNSYLRVVTPSFSLITGFRDTNTDIASSIKQNIMGTRIALYA